jgi:hypothetical protein
MTQRHAQLAPAVRCSDLAMAVETLQNTLINAANKRSRDATPESDCEAPQHVSCDQRRAAKRRCTFSSVARVRVVTTAEELPESCAGLFASWDDSAECQAPAAQPALYEDYVLEAKVNDGPEIIARMTSDLMMGVSNRTVADQASMIASLRASLVQSGWQPQVASANLELALVSAVSNKIQSLIDRVNKNGKAGLLPSCVSIGPAYLGAMHALQRGLHCAALAGLQSRPAPLFSTTGACEFVLAVN